MQKKFLRRDAKRFSKFGKGRGKKAKWRNQSGRHNKIREGKKGYPAAPAIGYGNKKPENAFTISNVKDLTNVGKGKEVMIARVGAKKKIEIAKKAAEMGLKIKNMNAKAFVKKTDKKKKAMEKKKPAAKEDSKVKKEEKEDGKK